MEKKELDTLVALLRENRTIITEEVWTTLLLSLSESDREYLKLCARNVTQNIYGKGVFVRALIEISSYCRNNCYYCGLRCSNSNAQRYRLSKNEILDCCRKGADLGFNTFVLQGGEDPFQDDAWIADVVQTIKSEFPEKAVTLSLGERMAGYELFRRAGADRYLLRHETADEEHYSFLHPGSMSCTERKRALFELSRLGFQVGAGMMIGSPGQEIRHIIADLMFLDSLRPQMIGIGPFIPAQGTPFAKEQNGSVELTLYIISLLRLRFNDALIPATTAVATLCDNGTKRAVLAGANVVMPNLTPVNARGKYTIYDNKKSNGSESAEQLCLLEERLQSIGYHIDYSRGDYKSSCGSEKIGFREAIIK